ncbi:hypothetical protein SAMN05216567_11998 [Variovorax sp. OK605]|uniref:hypothetical protein n=1 Tax=unclassified Variovorax TaxID=663243 RepID=UPI0008C0361A|nr:MULTISPECIES: hypothetical protein [unclassified Variovorax]SEJ58490.1 hypothetical protein SAMN05518853_102659 [Variovorax sp. OK202]SFC63778.1 hypothetical protein SAMN05444746_102659 [Variovorax sp. OK212]SFQ55119.1 hypothetical protein SAMN05216567_11998 [Variovorax sp. OK605]
MIKIGTLCHVVDSCQASPFTARAVGRIVEVVSAPYEAPSERYLSGTYYDVLFEGWTFYCRSDKLVPISDPDAHIERWEDAFLDEPSPSPTPLPLPNPAAQSTSSRSCGNTFDTFASR